MRLARALPLVILLALLLVLPASAHALLVRSSPESDAEMLVAPSTIEMWFSEPLETAFTSARLIGPDGNELPTSAAVVNPSEFHACDAPAWKSRARNLHHSLADSISGRWP